MFQVNIKKISTHELNKMLRVAGRLKKLDASNESGWADYCLLLDNYIKNLLEYKKNFNISQATDEQIYQLKLYDRDIWLISNFIRKAPRLFVENLEAEIKKKREEAETPTEGEL